MKKDFDGWHKKKSEIDESNKRILFHEREVWFVSLGLNVGHEQNGGKGFLRPVVIVKKFNDTLYWAVPLTKANKIGKYYMPVLVANTPSVAILSQLRLMDVKRLDHKMGVVNENEFGVLKTRLTRFLM